MSNFDFLYLNKHACERKTLLFTHLCLHDTETSRALRDWSECTMVLLFDQTPSPSQDTPAHVGTETER